MNARKQAEKRLDAKPGVGCSTPGAITYAGSAVAWALLDLADAVRIATREADAELTATTTRDPNPELPDTENGGEE